LAVGVAAEEGRIDQVRKWVGVTKVVCAQEGDVPVFAQVAGKIMSNPPKPGMRMDISHPE